MVKILIGSCGGLTGLYLAKVLRKMDIGERFEIYGFDITTKVPTKFFLDKLFVISRSSEEKEFIDQLIEILNKERIDIYIPVHSEECRVVSKYQTEILKRSRSKFMISPYETFKMLDNKANAYKILKGIGLKTPKIYTSYHDVDEFPVVVKPAVGSGSRGFFICRNREELELATTIYRDALIMEYIDGKEYTVDAFFNKKVSWSHTIRESESKRWEALLLSQKTTFRLMFVIKLKKLRRSVKYLGLQIFSFF